MIEFTASLIPNRPIKSPFNICLDQEQLECSKRGWELKHLQKLKEEDEELQLMEGDELFTYTREDAYNMVRGLFHSKYGPVPDRIVDVLLGSSTFLSCLHRSTCSKPTTITRKSCR